MKKDEYKKEYIDRIKNNKEKNFEIEKVSLSKDDPILQHTKKLTGGIDFDYVVKQSKDLLNTPPDNNFSYKGRKTRTIFKVIEAPGKFYGIKIGPIRIGLWREFE